MGTNLDVDNIQVQTKFSALQLQRQKFLNAMRNTKQRENETMAKFNDFVSKVNHTKDKTGLVSNQQWMAKPLKFHVDSEKAYNVQKAKEYEATVGTGKNFE